MKIKSPSAFLANRYRWPCLILALFALLKAMDGHVLAQGERMGTYQK